MKIKSGTIVPTAFPRVRGRVLTYRNRDERVWLQTWPRKRGAATQGGLFYQQGEFALAASWASDPEPIALQTAKALSEGTSNVPRDLLVAASYGTYYAIKFADGTPTQRYRDVAPNAQLILDQVTDTPGAMLWRGPQGWIELLPGDNGQVIMSDGHGPIYADVGTVPGSNPAAPPTSPVLQDPTVYAGPLTFGAGLPSSVGVANNQIWFTPVMWPYARNITAIALKTSVAVAGSQARLGVWKNDHVDGGPGTLVVDGGTVTTSVLGHRSVAVSAALLPGLYWVGAKCTGSAFLWCNATNSGLSGCGWNLGAAPGSPNAGLYLVRNDTFANPFGSELAQTHTRQTGVQPIFGIR